GLALPGELDVRTPRLHADLADHGDAGVAQLLVVLVRKRHLRRDGDGTAGWDAHRVEVLDRAHDDDVVVAVPHQLELELVPADQRLLDEDLADGALAQGAVEQQLELASVARRPSAVAAEREGRPKDHREGELGRDVVPARDDGRRRAEKSGEPDGLAKELTLPR